jgi:gamma-glutamyltranspeptidase/glutathione hydrolase
LRAGGSAIEAIVAAAATLSVVYPHMCGLGGDGFWVIGEPGKPPVGICAAGRAGARVDADLYRRRGHPAIPARGPLAATTVAGAVDGWRAALDLAAGWGPVADPNDLFADAIAYAEQGAFVSRSQALLTREGYDELAGLPGFGTIFLRDGDCPREGDRIANPALARTFRRLARDGLDSFYRGPLAADIAADLERAGAALGSDDLAAHRGSTQHLLSLSFQGMRVYQHPPPSQGIACLMILALLDRLGIADADPFAHVHLAVEATKLAFADRDRHIGDPARMTIAASSLLDPAYLDTLAARIDRCVASPWQSGAGAGDTVWLGAIDDAGRAVSYIQSLYFDFGSGVVLPETGIVWQNRGASFTLGGHGPRALAPRSLPFHTLSPAFVAFDDGRRMVFGAMGGDGQPQTQAAILPRYAMFGMGLQEAVSAPRWLLGRRWADAGAALKLESRFDPAVIDRLSAAGHAVEIVEPFSDLMGHAGAIVRHADGALAGAADPRSDGAVAGW